MPIFTVHDFHLCRTAYRTIEADSMEEAIEFVEQEGSMMPADGPHDAEDQQGYLVDQMRDDDQSEIADSRFFECQGLESLGPDEDDSRFPRSEWMRQVANEETIQGYSEWRTHRFLLQEADRS